MGGLVVKTNRVLLLVVLILVAVFLTGCMPGNDQYTEKPAGFFWGIWHGWIAPISLIGQLFNSSIRVYEASNVGWWYDFGFYLAIAGGFGGLSLSRRRRRNCD